MSDERDWGDIVRERQEAAQARAKARTKALEEAKAGDMLAVLDGGTPMAILRVERTTKTQIILTNGERYWRATGRRVGGSAGFHPPPRLELPTDAYREWIRHRVLAQKAERGVYWLRGVVRELPTEDAEALCDFVDALKRKLGPEA